jgi:hypothetical protein
MSSNRDPKQTNGDARVIVSAITVRDECQFRVRRIPSLVAPEVTSRKKQYEIVSRLTGIAPRRVKDYWRGEIKDPPGSQDRTIQKAYRAALLRWRESALAQLKEIEAEHEDNLGAAARYSAQRWERTRPSGCGVGDVGEAADEATNSD